MLAKKWQNSGTHYFLFQVTEDFSTDWPLGSFTTMLLACGPHASTVAPSVAALSRIASSLSSCPSPWPGPTAADQQRPSATNCLQQEPIAGPGPSSLRNLLSSGFAGTSSCVGASLEARRYCRWLGETRCQTVTAADLGTGQPAAGVAVLETKLHGDGDVRMDAQVIFESCWRRFEEKYRLKVQKTGRNACSTTLLLSNPATH